MRRGVSFLAVSAYFTEASASRARTAGVILIATAVIAGLAVRWALRDFISGDWTLYLQYWQRFLVEYDGLPALRYAFSNYTAPYTYTLAIATQLLQSLLPLHQIKLVSVLFDLALAGLAWQLVAQFQTNPLTRGLAFATVFLAPTVVLNSAAWSQADSIFTTFLLASLLALCKKRYRTGMTLYAIALSFKLQSIFMLPLFVFLAAERSMQWRVFLLLPAAYALMNAPALLMGRPPAEMMAVYAAQIDRYDDLTLNAPSVFQWLSPEPRDLLHQIGYAMTAGFVLVVWIVARRSQRPIAEQPLLVATLLLAGAPFFLPRMHDRYFYAADVVSIVLAFAYASARACKAALAINAASLSAYITYLWSNNPSMPKVSLSLAALFIAAALVWLMEMLRGERVTPALSWRALLPPMPQVGLDVRWPEWRWVGVAVLAVAAAAVIGGQVRAANDQAALAATFERNGQQVQLHRAHATQCDDTLQLEMTWTGSTLRTAPGDDETVSVFVHVYDPRQQRIVVADGYVAGAFLLNKIEFDMVDERSVALNGGQRAASVRVGAYAIETGERFHAARPNGAAWEGDEVIIPVAACDAASSIP